MVKKTQKTFLFSPHDATVDTADLIYESYPENSNTLR